MRKDSAPNLPDIVSIKKFEETQPKEEIEEGKFERSMYYVIGQSVMKRVVSNTYIPKKKKKKIFTF